MGAPSTGPLPGLCPGPVGGLPATPKPPTGFYMPTACAKVIGLFFSPSTSKYAPSALGRYISHRDDFKIVQIHNLRLSNRSYSFLNFYHFFCRYMYFFSLDLCIIAFLKGLVMKRLMLKRTIFFFVGA